MTASSPFPLQMLQALTHPGALAMLGTLYLLSAAALPLCHRWFDRSHLTWYASARFVGLALVGYTAWLVAHVAPGGFSRTGLWAVAGGGILLSVWGWTVWSRALMKRLRAQACGILTGEAIFLLAFAFCAGLRMQAPDIREAEKFMDMALLTHAMYTDQMPMPDPWLFQGDTNYYYGGHAQMAALAKMAGVAPEIAYNVSVAVVYAWFCLLVFACALEVNGRLRWALLSLVVVAVMANLDVGAQVWERWATGSTKPFEVQEWRASRVIHDGPLQGKYFETINEFPFFTFMHADLHAHLLALPWVLVLLATVANAVRRRKGGLALFGEGGWRWGRLALGAWALGTLAMTNGFDFITFSLLLPLFFFYHEWFASRGWHHPARFLRGGAVNTALTLSLALVFAAPFLAHYQLPSASKDLLSAGAEATGFFARLAVRSPFELSVFRSHPGQYLIVWGTQFFALGALLAAPVFLRMKHLPDRWKDAAWQGLLLLWLAAYCVSGGVVAASLICLLATVGVRLMQARKTPRTRLFHFFIGAALLILTLCEFFGFHDGLGKGYQRLNMLFKFHYPGWILLGLVWPVCLREIWGQTTWPRGVRIAVLAGAGVLALVGLSYPVAVTRGRIVLRENLGLSPTLDGLDYMRREEPGDYQAIQWLRQNARAGEVALEGGGDSYSYQGRIATHTPVRSVLAWANHQWIWRGKRPVELQKQVQAVYKTPNPGEALALLKQWGVRYVVVGGFEYDQYPEAGLAKFGQMFPEVFRDPETDTVIYRVDKEDEVDGMESKNSPIR